MRPMRNYPVKENHIGSAISGILWYRQTQTNTHKHRQTDRDPILYKDNSFVNALSLQLFQSSFTDSNVLFFYYTIGFSLSYLI